VQASTVPIRFLTPFAFLALLPLGQWLGGAWTFLAALATPLGLPVLDHVFGDDERRPNQASALPAFLPRIYAVLQLAATVWAGSHVALVRTSLLEATGLTLSAGVTTGVFGFVAAHELIHSRDRRDRALGLTLLGSVLYMHFRIAHVFGHHRKAATLEDSASARLGESLYAFLARSVAGQIAEAWTFEANRLRRTGRRVTSPANRMLRYLFVEATLLLVIGFLGVRALAFVLGTTMVSVTLLEGFNYIAHYGLSRGIAADGRIERLAARHSWNSSRRTNNAALFNMGRHSDHHRFMTRSYEQLEPVAEEPRLPAGYAAALLTALIPPLWRQVMDPRARAAERTGGRAP
jgi:alkane 1-monooxygenase